MAEYIGGIWVISPRNRASTASTWGRSAQTGWVSSTVPVVSWVSVTTPRRRPARYSFSRSAANSTARVARPTKTGRTPVAMGLQGAGVADPSLPEKSPELGNHIVAGPAGGFVDD